LLRCWRRAAWALAIAVSVAGCATSTASTTRTTATTATTKAQPEHPPARRNAGPLSGLRLYVSPHSPAAFQVAFWRSTGETAKATSLKQIAREPTATWLTGAQPPQASAAALVRQSSQAGATAQIVLYDIPDRDCSGFSGGGAATGSQYLAWVTQVERGLGNHAAIIILEPDAIDQAIAGCPNLSSPEARFAQMAKAVTILKRDHRAHVYIDAGNSSWLPIERIVGPLYEAGIQKADGFALNVANFQTTQASIAYGRALSNKIGGRHFVIDTSRNGNGPPSSAPGVNQWCNPPGRALGAPPTTNTGIALVDAFLWVKYPGESDGQCGSGDPPAGQWWPAYGLQLAKATQH
jgi:endoglucanase